MASTTIGSAYIQIKPSMDGVQKSIQNQLKGTGEAAGEDVNSEMSKTIAKSTAIGTALGKVLYDAAKKAADAISDLFADAFDYANKITAASKVLQSMGHSEDDVRKATEKLRASLKKLPTSTASALKGVQQLAASWGDLDFSTDAFEAFNAAILYGGGTTENLENAITQLSQVALDGPLDAQTWLSLRNSGLLPAAQAVAELNGMTVNELKESLGSGEMTTREFMNALIGLNSETGKFTQGAEAANQTVSGAWATMRKNVVEKVGEMMNKLDMQEGLAGVIKKLEDVVVDMVEKGGDFITWMQDGSDGAKIFQSALAGLAGAAGFGALAGAVKGVSKALSVVGSVLSTPVAILGALVGVIVAMGVAIYNFRDDIKDFLLNGLPNWFNNTFNSLSQWGADVADGIGKVGYDISNKFKRAGEEFQMMGEDIKNFFTGIGPWLSERADEARTGIENAFKDIGQWFGDRRKDIESFFSGIPEWFRKTFEGAKNKIKEVWSGIPKWFEDRYNDIKNTFSLENLAKVGKQIVEGLWNGINSMGAWIHSKIEGFGDSVLNALKDFFGIHSPSRVMRDQVGVMLGRGMAEGILDSKSIVNAAMTELGEDALNQMSALDGSLSGTITTSYDAGSALFDQASNARVVQNNVFNIADNFDLQQVSSDLGYAVAMA